MNKLNQNLKRTIATKFGRTDTIDTDDNIQQGTPLSGPEFALLIDQLNVDIRAEGYGILYSHLIIVSLLFTEIYNLDSRFRKTTSRNTKSNKSFLHQMAPKTY